MSDFRPGGWSLLPVVVKNLLIINGIMFLAQMVIQNRFQVDLTDWLGLYYPTSSHFHGYQFVTYMFMHGSFEHVFMNMFSFWMFGSVLENTWGSQRFLFFYLSTGVGAALCHMGVEYYQLHQLQAAASDFLNHPTPAAFTSFLNDHGNGINPNIWKDFVSPWQQSPENISYVSSAKDMVRQVVSSRIDVPTVGASGAVYGILLAFGMMFPNTLVFVGFFIPMKAKYFVAIFGLIELYSGWRNASGDNVAHFAHLGGMLFGFILIWYWRKSRRDELF